MPTRRNWLLVPLAFGPLLGITLIVRWLPAAWEVTREIGGLGRVIGGDIVLVWKGMLRLIVVLPITVMAVRFLPPLSRRQAFAISVVAVAAEWVAEMVMGAVFGADAELGPQLVATTIAYVFVVFLGAFAVYQAERRHGAGMKPDKGVQV